MQVERVYVVYLVGFVLGLQLGFLVEYFKFGLISVLNFFKVFELIKSGYWNVFWLVRFILMV